MPKKVSNKNTKTKEDDNEEKEILKELAESLKEEKTADKEETLEEVAEPIETPNINLETSSPVLERITEQQAIDPRFFSTVSQENSATNTITGEGGNSSYIPSTEQTEESRYISGGEEINMNTTRSEAARQRTGFFNQQPTETTREMFFQASEEAQPNQSTWSPEKTWNVGRNRERDKKDFESDEIKYEAYNPDMPK